MVVPRVRRVGARDRIGEPAFAREMAQRRVANLSSVSVATERREDAPEQDVAREVEWLRQRIVGRRLRCRDEPERRAGGQETIDHAGTGSRETLAQRGIRGEARVIGDEKERPELLIQLERGIFDRPRRE